MHPTTRALLEAISRVLDVPPKRFNLEADKAADDAMAAWGAAGRPDLQPLVGGDPPVPGVGWGVVGDPLRGVVRVRRIVTMGPEWIAWVDDDPAMQRRVTQSTVRAVYRLGDSATAPFWRRE